MTSKNQYGSNSWGTLYERPMEGWCFAMIGMKKFQDILNEGYALSCNGNVHALLTLKIFGWFC